MITTTYKIKNDFRKILQIFDEQSNTWHFQHPYTYSKFYRDDCLVLEMYQEWGIVFVAEIKPGVGERVKE